jgi:hypothetical protein
VLPIQAVSARFNARDVSRETLFSQAEATEKRVQKFFDTGSTADLVNRHPGNAEFFGN